MAAFDILVVGAGIIGTAVARECAFSGLSVGIIESHIPGGGITAAGMGHVVVMDDSPAQLALSSYSRALWRQETESLPARVEYQSAGTVWVAADEEEMAEVHAKHATYRRAGVLSHVLDAVLLAKEEPNLRSGLAGGLLVPDDGVVYPPAAAAHFLEQATVHGCMLFHQRAVAAGGGEVRLNDGTRLAAERIVLAVGFDCSLLPAMPIQRRKGHLVITDRYPGFAHHQLVELGYLKSAHAIASDSVAFNIQPRSTGQMLIGSSRQYGNTDTAVDPVLLRRMLQRAEEYMPGIADLSSIRVWTGFRAATKDKLPLIGPAHGLSEDSSLWLATGFEGLGITNAPGAARILVDQMLARPSEIDRTPYLPERLLTAQEAVHA